MRQAQLQEIIPLAEMTSPLQANSFLNCFGVYGFQQKVWF